MIAYWRQHWEYSQALFARIYQLNACSFSRWLNGHKDSPKSRRSIISWIENGCIHPKIFHSWSEIEEKIKLIKYQSVIFCDGDQLTYFNGICRINEVTNKQLLFLCYGNWQTIHHIALKMEGDNILLRQTFATQKDASDFRLTLDLGRLDAIVDLEIPFVIITEDHFYIELINGIRERGRRCLQYCNLITYLGPSNLNPDASEFIPSFPTYL